MGWQRKLICFAHSTQTRTNNLHSNQPGIPAAAAHLPTSLAVAERPATAVVSTLLLPVSTPRLLLAHTVTSPRLVRTRAAASQRPLRRTPPRPLVVTMALGTIRGKPRRVLLPIRGVGCLFDQAAEACSGAGETSE